MYVRELTDHPGIVVSDTRETRESKIARVISFNETEFTTLDEAVRAQQVELRKTLSDAPDLGDV